MSNSNMNITDWQSIKPIGITRKPQGYIEVPTFEYNDITWLGASAIVVQFNYSADRNFCITSLPAKPTSTNFIMCIKYRIGSDVYRYKLWDNADGVLDVPMYNNEIIRKNFCIEIWNVATSTTVSNTVVRTVVTSLLNSITNLSVTTNYKIADGEVCVNTNAFVPSYPEGASLRYQFLNEGADLDYYVNPSSNWTYLFDYTDKTKFIYFPTANPLVTTDGFAGNNNIMHTMFRSVAGASYTADPFGDIFTQVFLVFFPSTTNGVTYPAFRDRYTSLTRTGLNNITYYSDRTNPTADLTISVVDALDKWVLFVVSKNANGFTYTLYDFATMAIISDNFYEAAITANTPLHTEWVGVGSILPAVDDVEDGMYFAHITSFPYASNDIQFTETIFPQLRSYLQYVHLLAQNYDPLQLPPCVAWLDNPI